MRLKAIIGYTFALLTIPVALGTFLGMDLFAHKLVSATGLHISAWYTGGEVVKTVDHGAYQTLQHRPVFDAAFGQKPVGFIQIDWSPDGSLPAKVTEDIDFDNSGRADFRIEYDPKTNTAILSPYSTRVISLAGCYQLKGKRSVRVNLRNTD